MIAENISSETPAAESNNKKLTVLVIEDSPSQAIKLKVTLENSNCVVYWGSTGKEGLKLAKQLDVDLIVLDIELPDINGFEVCRQLKSIDDLSAIPVVMMTTRDKAVDAMSGFNVGAIDYIPKDVFAEAVLLATIKKMQTNN